MKKLLLKGLFAVLMFSRYVANVMNGEVGIWVCCFFVSIITFDSPNTTRELHEYFNLHLRQRFINFGWEPMT